MLANWKKYLFFLLLLAVAVAIALYFHYRHKPVTVRAFVPPPTHVTLTTAKLQRWPTVLQGNGTVTADKGVMVRAQVAGQILKQYVHSSTEVKAGELLYQIDPQGLAQLISQNEATLALKKEQLEEQRQLYKNRFVSKNAFDMAEAAFKVALNTLRENQHKLILSEVRAPFSGKVGVMLVHQGDFVNVNTPLVSLQDPQDMRVDFTLPGNFANLPEAGQLVKLNVLEYPDLTFEAQVTSVNASVDPNNQTLLVRAHLNHPQKPITPGSFADVQLYVNTGRSVVTVPDTALVYSDEGIGVYQVIDGVARIKSVEVGQRMGTWVEILHGINAGDTIVSEGKVKLMDGARVTG